jgi:hypothetical protein
MTSQFQQIAECFFDFSHLGGAELAHAPGEFALIENGESMHVHSGVFGQPAGFAEMVLGFVDFPSGRSLKHLSVLGRPEWIDGDLFRPISRDERFIQGCEL